MNIANRERRRFLQVVIFSGVFLLFAKKLGPFFSFSQKHFSEENTVASFDKKENQKEIIFSDKSGNKVLVVEK